MSHVWLGAEGVFARIVQQMKTVDLWATYKEIDVRVSTFRTYRQTVTSTQKIAVPGQSDLLRMQERSRR